jgi:antitoxin Phd
MFSLRESFMASYTLTELSRASGAIVEAAFKGPVDLTDRGKRKFVLVTAEMFDQLDARSRRAVHVDDLSDAERDLYLRALSADEA